MLRKVLVGCLTVFPFLGAPARAGLIFDISDTGNPAAGAAFAVAAARWSALFKNPVTVNLQAGFTALDAGILSQTNATRGIVSYSDFVNALSLNPFQSADDLSAAAQLRQHSSISMLINRTSDNPNGSGSAIPFLDNNGDANNNSVWLSSANAKALGLLDSRDPLLDAAITFNAAYPWDFDPSDGITPGYFDFAGIATHEIGHALGFFSGVDVLDYNAAFGPFPSWMFSYVTPMDLFRFSASSVAAGVGVIDWTAGPEDKYFSLDGGVTRLSSFSTGLQFGDGSQASHWKNGLGIGLMDPITLPGQLLTIGYQDARVLDAVGWTMVVPEPAAFTLCAFGIALLLARRLRSNVR